jgi:hypothetical protein
MSHIYEALQRAEAERKSGAQAVATPEEPRHQSLAFAAAMPPVAAEVAHPLEIVAPVVTEEPVTVDPSFLGDVRRRPWNPSLERLPALASSSSAACDRGSRSFAIFAA